MNPNRRRLIQGSAALILYPSSGYVAAQVFGEATRDSISDSRAQAVDLRRRITEADLNAEAISQFQNQELALRQELWGTLNEVDEDALGDYVLKEQRTLYDELIKENISPLPFQEQLQKTPVAKAQCRSIQDVALDIFLETFGLSDSANVIKEIVNASDELQEAMDDMSKATGFQEWEKVVDGLLKIVALLRKPPPAVIGKVGEEAFRRFKRTLLAKVALRFVPFVGQAYLAASFALAVYSNKQRLLEGCPESADSE